MIKYSPSFYFQGSLSFVTGQKDLLFENPKHLLLREKPLKCDQFWLKTLRALTSGNTKMSKSHKGYIEDNARSGENLM